MNSEEAREQKIRQYAEGPKKIRAALAKVPKEALQWRPAPGKWSVHEVVCHCADSEMNAAMRARYLIAEPKPHIVAYDQDLWAKALDYHAQPLEPALATVEAVRATTAALLRRAPQEAWRKAGHHSETGTYTLERWLELYSQHLEGHAQQIERNLAAWQSKSAKPTTNPPA
jgi:hypothetical protein